MMAIVCDNDHANCRCDRVKLSTRPRSLPTSRRETITVCLQSGLFVCDHTNEFSIVLCPVALVFLGVGLAMFTPSLTDRLTLYQSCASENFMRLCLRTPAASTAYRAGFEGVQMMSPPSASRNEPAMPKKLNCKNCNISNGNR